MNELQFLIETAYPAAQSAYTAMNVPTPPLNLPAGYTLVDTILANPREAAPLVAQSGPDQQRLVNHMVAESSIFGLVAFNAAERTAIIAIRGTRTLMDWVDDIEALLLPYAPFPGAGLVHSGFLCVYENIRGSIRSLISQCAGVQRVIVTGHSLGGALAVLCAFDILKNFNLNLVPELHTFAGPRVGNPHFAGQFNALIPIANRVVNFLDFVPQLPIPPLYEHVGKETLVHGGFRILDPTYAHHLTTYLAGLHKLPGAPQAAFTRAANAAAATGTAQAGAAAIAGAQAVVIAAEAGAAQVTASVEAANRQNNEVEVAPEPTTVR